MIEKERFIADGMLGKLAKWLRLMGYDTFYCPEKSDNEIIRIARIENRLLLTRDLGIIRRKGIKSLFIKSLNLKEQLSQVINDCHLTSQEPFGRCPVCNSSLQKLADERIAELEIPNYVKRTQKGFNFCQECQRLYWRGTHWKKIIKNLSSIKE